MQEIKATGGQFGYTELAQTTHRYEVPMKASAAIAAGDVVAFVAFNTDVEPTIKKADVSENGEIPLICGVALNAAAAAGDLVQVVRLGPAKVNISTDTVAAGECATVHGSVDGAATGVAADATSVIGDYFGVFLGAEIGTTNQAWVDVRPGSS